MIRAVPAHDGMAIATAFITPEIARALSGVQALARRGSAPRVDGFHLFISGCEMNMIPEERENFSQSTSRRRLASLAQIVMAAATQPPKLESFWAGINFQARGHSSHRTLRTGTPALAKPH
jgi:hypothetical protein